MKYLIICLLTFLLTACNSDSVKDALENPGDAIDIIEGIDRKAIDTNRMGVNAFGNKAQFGSVCQQFADVRDSLRLRYIRILVQWNDAVQPSPTSVPNFGFYDELVNCIPAGVDALVVVAGLPGWMSNPANWLEGNPRTTFVQRWLRPVVNRYGNRGGIVGFQVWNEPNMASDPDNTTLDVLASPDNYVELLARAYSVIKDGNGSKLVVNAATTSLVQNYPDTLNYNKALRNSGIESFVDVYAIHYYGKQFEKFISGGKDFLRSLSKPIWITESGQQGVNSQLAYVETAWPYLREHVPGIDRIYYYQYASEDSPENSFGLRNPSADMSVSDLFIFLRDR